MPLARSAIIAEARAWIGTPYRHQASLKGVGCDCLGLVRGVWRALHGAEPEATPRLYARLGRGVAAMNRSPRLRAASRRARRPRARSRRATCCCFATRRAIRPSTPRSSTAPDLMVHAHDGAAVAEVAIAPWWRRRLAYAFRISRSDRLMRLALASLRRGRRRRSAAHLFCPSPAPLAGALFGPAARSPAACRRDRGN